RQCRETATPPSRDGGEVYFRIWIHRKECSLTAGTPQIVVSGSAQSSFSRTVTHTRPVAPADRTRPGSFGAGPRLVFEDCRYGACSAFSLLIASKESFASSCVDLTLA